MSQSKSKSHYSDWSLWVSVALFSLFLLNVVVGKLSIVLSDRSLPLSLSPVSEFLLLFAACIFFVVATLKAETRRDGSRPINPR